MLERGDAYDAAEKTWAAVRHATTALTTAFLKEAAPPRGVPWRTFVKNALVKAGLNEDETSSWASYYIDVRDRLHGGCLITHASETYDIMLYSVGIMKFSYSIVVSRDFFCQRGGISWV